MASPVDKYLARYASPEIELATAVDQRFRNVLVVPLLAESIDFERGLVRALGDNTLAIYVVNNREDASAAEKSRNAELIAQLSKPEQGLPRLVVDRASEGNELPAKQGVGLARRIGCDIACKLIAQGNVTSEWIHTTDADATLPVEYFSAADSHAVADAIALAYPFVHQRRQDAVGDAHARYEISLRHYVFGLRQAGSPYAHHSVGSTIAVRASAYAAVRGMPKRLAGEDFYLLNKLAKLGTIRTPTCTPIELAARRSQRAPFGTGPAVAKLLETPLTLYNPRSYALLGEWLRALEDYARDSILPRLSAPLSQALPGILGVGTMPEVEAGFSRILDGANAPAKRRRRLHDWFDGLRTLRLIHALRDIAGIPDLYWTQALSEHGLPSASPQAALNRLIRAGC